MTKRKADPEPAKAFPPSTQTLNNVDFLSETTRELFETFVKGNKAERERLSKVPKGFWGDGAVIDTEFDIND